jgi:hypothetical protein
MNGLLDCWIAGSIPILIIIADRQATVNSTQRRKEAKAQGLITGLDHDPAPN